MHNEASEILRSLDIQVASTRLKAANLSGGQRQSIAIGRAAAFEPAVLIMDEPTSALAVAEVEAVLRLIRRVSDAGVSVILITHRLQDLFRVCDRVMVLYEGRNVAERAISETSLEDLIHLIVAERSLISSGSP
jgi:simple sugar transport system ATP-binding protein